VPPSWASSYEALDPRAANARGITNGHSHFLVCDVEAHRHFWRTRGGVPVKSNGREYFQVQGTFVLLREAEPTGGTKSCVVAGVGFSVRSLKESFAKWNAAGLQTLPGPIEKRAFVLTPDGVQPGPVVSRCVGFDRGAGVYDGSLGQAPRRTEERRRGDDFLTDSR
jgi:hypothetical protein